MPYLVARIPVASEKPTRAEVRRRKPVKRDEPQIGTRESEVNWSNVPNVRTDAANSAVLDRPVAYVLI